MLLHGYAAVAPVPHLPTTAYPIDGIPLFHNNPPFFFVARRIHSDETRKPTRPRNMRYKDGSPTGCDSKLDVLETSWFAQRSLWMVVEGRG